MGKPRMIILIRHAQSEGNLNRDVHQIIPDHRVKLTSEGWKQANEAGYRLRDMLRPDDTIRIFTSPYRRTRETTEGLLKSLTESNPESGPSPFSRSAIKVYEEPRLREQDFGNFQPCSAEMERMWQERADYGHFFYRIPDGESAADAYDRCAGFNESLWRSFGEEDFPSVCILVTHGLMTRVFLMKWYHWTVEYFEDLRNVNHCEFVIMNKQENGKYRLGSKLRTWSELKRRATHSRDQRKSSNAQPPAQLTASSPTAPRRIWGGCVDGCKHDHSQYPRRNQIRAAVTSPTAESPKGTTIECSSTSIAETLESSRPSTDAAGPHPDGSDNADDKIRPPAPHSSASAAHVVDLEAAPAQRPGPTPLDPSPRRRPSKIDLPLRPQHADLIPRGRDAGGSLSGLPTPLSETASGDEQGSLPEKNDKDPGGDTASPHPPPPSTSGPREWHGSLPEDSVRTNDDDADSGSTGPFCGDASSSRPRKPSRRPTRQTTTEDMEGWMKESGMGMGRRADALGDPEEEEEDEDQAGSDADGHLRQGMEDRVKRVEKAEERDKSLIGSVY